MSDVLRQRLQAMAPEQRVALLKQIQSLSPEQRTSLKTRLEASGAAVREPATQPSQDGLEAFLKPAEAFTEGFGQTATMGYAPQLQAATQQLMPDPSADVDEQLKAQGFNIQQPENTYVAARDRFIDRGNQLQKEQPLAMGTGQVVGAINNAILTGAGLGKVAPGLASKAMSLKGALGKGAATTGLMGAIYNPGDETGVVHNPIEGDVQAGDRAKNAAMSAAVSLPLSAVGYGVGRVADKYNMFTRLQKDPMGLAKDFKNKITQGARNITRTKVRPESQSLSKAFAKDSIDVNPSQLKGISPGLDKYAQALDDGMPKTKVLVEKGDPSVVDAAGRALKPDKFKSVNKSHRTQLPGDKALRLRKQLDRRSTYRKGSPLESDPGVVKSSEAAKKQADILRNRLDEARPDLSKRMDKLAETIRVRNEMTRAARKPDSAIAPGKDLTRRGVLKEFDRAAGTNLERIGKDYTAAKSMEFGPNQLSYPLSTLLKLAKRATGYGASKMEGVADRLGGQRALIDVLLEGKRKEGEK